MSIPGCFSSGVMTARLKAVGNRPDDNDAFINDETDGAVISGTRKFSHGLM